MDLEGKWLRGDKVEDVELVEMYSPLPISLSLHANVGLILFIEVRQTL